MFLLSAATLFSAMSSRCRAISLILLALNLSQNLREFIGALFTLYFIVDHQHGCLAASAHTATFFQRDLPIRRGLTQFDAQHLFGFLDQLRYSRDVAGCSQTE